MRSVEKGESETAEMIKRLTRSVSENDPFSAGMGDRRRKRLGFIKDFLSRPAIPLWPGVPVYAGGRPGDFGVEDPKLVIQPFVENACLHGIEGSDRLGEVGITLRPTGGRLIARSRIMGSGCSAEKLRRLWADIKAEEPRETDLAIRNIYQRLSSITGGF